MCIHLPPPIKFKYLLGTFKPIDKLMKFTLLIIQNSNVLK